MIELLSPKRIKILCYAMASLFLVIHIGMLYVFALYGVTPMAYFNVFSVTFYIVMLFLIHGDHLHAFVVATFLEINLHMGLAVVFTGWGSGFQITLIGVCLLLFYSEYVARSMKMSYTPALYLSPVAMVVYLFSFVSTMNRPPLYVLPKSMENAIQIAWAFVVFVIMTLILQIFVFRATRSQDLLSNEVLHDKLTGLPNRFYMSLFFSKMEANAKYWIAIADIDDFKCINDTYGHNCGDYVLKTLAGIIRESAASAEVCRWGGEEFLIADKGEIADSATVLEAVRQAVDAHAFNYEGAPLHLTLTIGVASFEAGQSIDEWINAADKRLYEGKHSGKNRVVWR